MARLPQAALFILTNVTPPTKGKHELRARAAGHLRHEAPIAGQILAKAEQNILIAYCNTRYFERHTEHREYHRMIDYQQDMCNTRLIGWDELSRPNVIARVNPPVAYVSVRVFDAGN